jgi:Golgi nucleoside diphosphatase
MLKCRMESVALGVTQVLLRGRLPNKEEGSFNYASKPLVARDIDNYHLTQATHLIHLQHMPNIYRMMLYQ